MGSPRQSSFAVHYLLVQRTQLFPVALLIASSLVGHQLLVEVLPALLAEELLHRLVLQQHCGVEAVVLLRGGGRLGGRVRRVLKGLLLTTLRLLLLPEVLRQHQWGVDWAIKRSKF